MKRSLNLLYIVNLMQCVFAVILIMRFKRSVYTDVVFWGEMLVFILFVFLLIWDNIKIKPKAPVYTNIYGATGNQPWPPHLMTGPTGYTGAVEQIKRDREAHEALLKMLRITGPGGTEFLGPAAAAYTGYTGSAGSTSPSYTFGQPPSKKKKL